MTANPTSHLNPVLMAARCTLLVATAGGIQAMLAVSNYTVVKRRIPDHASRKLKRLEFRGFSRNYG